MGIEIDAYLEYLRNTKRYSEHTLIAYAEDLNQFVEFCEKSESVYRWEKVTCKVVRHFEAGLMAGILEFGEGKRRWKVKPQSAKSVRRKLSSLRSMFRYLLQKGVVESDPVELVIAPKIGKKLPVFVPEDEMNELLDNQFDYNDFSSFRDMMILKMAYCTGMRRSELVSLKVDDLDLTAKVVKVTGKGDKQRIVPLVDELLSDIERYLAVRVEKVKKAGEHPFFFITDKGKRAGGACIQNHVKKYLSMVRALSKSSPHVLRHSFATALLNNGKPALRLSVNCSDMQTLRQRRFIPTVLLKI